MTVTSREKQLLRHTFIDYQQTNEFLENPLIIDRAEGPYYFDKDGLHRKSGSLHIYRKPP